jgi:hypothetical protein
MRLVVEVRGQPRKMEGMNHGQDHVGRVCEERAPAGSAVFRRVRGFKSDSATPLKNGFVEPFGNSQGDGSDV